MRIGYKESTNLSNHFKHGEALADRRRSRAKRSHHAGPEDIGRWRRGGDASPRT